MMIVIAVGCTRLIVAAWAAQTAETTVVHVISRVVRRHALGYGLVGHAAAQTAKTMEVKVFENVVPARHPAQRPAHRPARALHQLPLQVRNIVPAHPTSGLIMEVHSGATMVGPSMVVPV